MKLALKSGVVPEAMESTLRARFESEPSDRRTAVALLVYLQETGAPITTFEEVCAKWREAVPDGEKSLADRALADRLATDDAPENRRRAVGIYESLLGGELDPDDRVAVLHNCATLHRELGDREAAKSKWREAYSLAPGNPAVQTSFSQLLAALGELDLALKVSNGEPLY